MNKKIVGIIITIIIIALVIGGVFFIVDLQKIKKFDKPIQGNTNINKMDIVLSLEDKIEDNTAWCGTFNLIWNDLKNNLAKQDIVFTPQLKVVENLNRGTFTSDSLS